MRLDRCKQKEAAYTTFPYRLGRYGLFAMGLILFSVMVVWQDTIILVTFPRWTVFYGLYDSEYSGWVLLC
ncbi:MAG: hypothetical protein IPG85_18055 [Bacteroidetes bacterium]|nr:hypothetical protein [Bacteroidota bacterium]